MGTTGSVYEICAGYFELNLLKRALFGLADGTLYGKGF